MALNPLREKWRDGEATLNGWMMLPGGPAFAMIETRKALDNLDDILCVEGLDGIYIGPSDLALALGHPPHSDTEEPELLEATLTSVGYKGTLPF